MVERQAYQGLTLELIRPIHKFRRKKFYNIGPWIQNFYVLGVGQHVGVVVLDAGDSVDKLKKRASLSQKHFFMCI
jgi:hypothetical protein